MPLLAKNVSGSDCTDFARLNVHVHAAFFLFVPRLDFLKSRTELSNCLIQKEKCWSE